MAERLVHTGYGNGQSNFPINVYVTYDTVQHGGADNYSTITCGMYVTTPGSAWTIGPWGDSRGSYVGTSSLTFDGAIPNFGGSRTLTSGKQFTVQHNNDGTGKATIYWKWGVNSSWGRIQNISGSFEIDLPKIPRYCTITSFTIAQRDETSVSGNWSVDASVSNAWCRCKKSSSSSWGSWTGVPWPDFVYGGLEANTSYDFQLRVKRQDSGLETDSSVVSQTTINWPHITSYHDFVIGNTLKVTLHNPLGRKCTVYFIGDNGVQDNGNYTYHTVIGPGYTSENETNFFYSTIPNSQSGKYKLRLYVDGINRDTTINGGTYYVRGTETPTFNSNNIINVVDTLHANDITGLNTKIIKGHNNITGTITPMTANKSASGKRYIVSANASPSSQEITHNGSNKTFTFNNITTNSFTVTAYDTRELPTQATKTIDLIDYAKPKINNFTITRQNGIGTYAIITAEGSNTYWTGWSQIKKYNTIQKVYYRYKPSGSSTWTISWTDITSSLTTNSNGNWRLTKTLDVVFTTTSKYDFQLYVEDVLESSDIKANTLSTANGFLWRDLKNKFLGINKKPERTLDINGDIGCNNMYINGKSFLDMVYPIGSVYLSINNTNPGNLFGGTWVQVSQGRFLIGAKTDNYSDVNNVVDFGSGNAVPDKMAGYRFAPEDRGGEYKHLITQAETGLREHTHQLRLSNTSGIGSYSDTAYRAYVGNNVDEAFRTGRVTGLSDKPNDYAAPFVDGTSSANAMEKHNNMPPYYAVFMWKRTA